MDFHRKSSCTKELRFRTFVLLVLLVFVNTIYCQQFNATNSSRFTVDCENKMLAENQSELSYIDCKCWHDRPDDHWQHERITKECSSNKMNGKVELTLSQKPNRRYLVEGSMISFMCCSRSWFYQTSKEFQWSVDGRRIRNTGNETMISNNTQYDDNNTICSNLTIDSIGISVTIQCVVNHRYFDTDGTIENSLSLRLHPCVLPRPFVILSPKTPLANDSQMFELSCHLTSSGEEGANFTWYQNGSPINSSFGSVNISLPELKISQLQTSLQSQTDPVKFGCMAKTKLGDTAIQNFTVVSHYNEAYCKSDDYVKELAVPRSLMKIRFDNLESCPDKVEITLRQEPAETYLVEGNNILLICCFRCWLDRYKVREFQWTVYNLTTQNINLTRVIKTNDIHVYYDVNTTICSNQTFNQLSPGLETVQCTVNYSDSNNNGTVDDNLSLRLHLCVLPRPFVTVNPKNLSVYDSQTFALSCQLTSAVEEGANVTWYKDGVLISSVSGSMPNRRQIMSNVSMSLQSQMDAVIFSCMAETRLGRTDLQNSTIAIFDNIGKYCENGDYSVGPTVPPITISEHHQSGNANLTLSWEPNKKYLIDGDSISWKCCFKCECILKNVSDIQWMVNDRIITHNTHQKTISNTSCGSMLVFNADMNLETIQCERNYTCSCEENNSTHDEGNNSTHDEENKSTHDAYLNKRIDPCVLPQPFVTINPKTLRVNDSQMFELSCYLTSAIQECARFTWYKDGNPIDSSSGSVYISYPRLGMSQLQTSLPLRMNPYTIGCNATTKLGNTNRQNSTVIVFDYSGQYCKSDDYDRELAVLQSHKKILFNNSTNCPKTEKGKVEITLRQRPTKKYLVVGDRISLICCFRCWFNRYEAREFQWTFDNQTIRSNWTQMMTISDTYYDVNNSLCSNLTFDQISNGSGTVQCTVNNTYYDNNRPFNDTLRLSLYLFVFPRPFVVINPKSVNVIHSEEFALSCYLTSAVEEGTNFTWYEDGVPINISSERMVSSPKLSISQLTARLQLQKDPIIFGCMAETELGRTGLQNSTIVVVDANDKYCKRNDYDRELSVRQNYMKIRFAILPSSCPNIETGKVELTLHQESITKYLVEGNRISLICCFRTWYSSSCFDGFQWTFNGQTIRNNWTQVTYDTYDVNGATCSNQTFDPISAGSGNVQCNASYSYNDSSNTIKDHLSLSLYLCVFPRPYVTISPKTLLVNDSDMFDFSCHLTSAIEEGANFTWYQDGELIDPFCGGTNITSQGLNTSLLQTSVRLQSHPITFSCVADTQLGMTSLSNSEVTIFDYNAKYCESEQDATMKSINWNRMKVRNVDSHPCQVKGSEGGSCSRMCSLNETSHPVWDAPNCAMCVSMEYRELLQRLEQIQPNQNTTMVAVDIAKNLSALTAQNDTLTQYNLNASLNVISNLTKIRHNETAGVEEVEAVIDVISNLLRPNNSEAWTQLQKENRSVTVSLLRFAEYYGSSLSKTLNNTNKSIIINSDNVVLVAYSMNQSELHGSRDFPASPNSTETRGDKISISINISSLSENRTRMLQVKIFTSYYRNIEDKLPSSNSGIVQSRVLSLTIIDEQGKPQNLMKPVVVVTLQHNKPICRSFERTCSFWNFTEGARVWDATGCSLISTNETHTVCSCNHLTNFAILMSRNPSNSSVLSTMSAVGCSISVTCLILTVIIYIVNWKQWKSDQSAVLLNLCVALIIANIIFLVGSDKTGLPDNAGPPDENCIPDGCKAVAVLLHYFFLAAFFLMLAEGIELLLYIIFVFHVRRKIETASIIATAWGCPLIIVVISIAVKGMKGYISEYNVCWLSIENGLIWAFAGPAFCIILVNFLILAIIMRRISRARFGATEFEKKRRLRATLWNISVICPVLGVTWAFGILSFSFDHEIFQYLFVVANSLQGMLIFLYHAVLRNKKISEGCCKPKKPKPVSVTHTNPQPTEKEEKKEEKKEEDKEEKTEEKKEEKKEEVTEEKIECVAKLVNFFMSLEKSGGFDASRSFMTTLSLSTEEQSLMNNSEVSVTAAVHSSSDDAPGTSDPDGVAPGGVAPGGVALDGVASDGADSCGIAPGGVVSGEFALGDVAPGGVSQGGITTVEIASGSVGPGMVSPDKAVVTEIPTVQEN